MAALSAAVSGDALLEAISNSQLLWQGRYTDRSSLDLLPVALLALGTLAFVLAKLVRRRLEATGESRPLLGREVRGLLPAILALQFCALFAMETIEQAVVYGHPLGGTLWLCAPVPIALVAHAALGVACAFALARVTDFFAGAVARIVRIVLAIAAVSRPGSSRIARSNFVLPGRRLLVAAEIGYRGPPRR